MNDKELEYQRQYARMRNIEYVPGTNERNPDYRPPTKASSPGCLPESTSVMTPYGLKRVGDIDVGDAVLAYDAKRGNTRAQRVLAKHCFKKRKLVEFTTGGGVTVRSSQDHAFWVDGRWIRAVSVPVGGELIRSTAGGNMMRDMVRVVSLVTEPEDVFKLVVNRDFTMLAESVVSHSFTRWRALQGMYWLLRARSRSSVRAQSVFSVSQ